MTLSVSELIELARVIRMEEKIKIDMTGGSITIRAKCTTDDKLWKPMVIETENASPVKVDKLGVYKVGEFLRVWVVKE